MPDDIYLGFDPGGERGFGVAVLIGTASRVKTVSTVSQAVTWAVEQCVGHTPVAAGIDTLLHWADGQAGWRPADWMLLTNYPAAKASVMSPNSLFGSMSIGGMALAMRLRERWSEITLNETHPKVLAGALGGPRYKDAEPSAVIAWFLERSGLAVPAGGTGHELDALLSAWATREGLSTGWDDLVSKDPSLLFPAGTVVYLWPDFPSRKAAPAT